jgi:hypothetical protein
MEAADLAAQVRAKLAERKSPTVRSSPETRMASSAHIEVYLWDDERGSHTGPFSRVEIAEKVLPAGTFVCISDGKGGFHEWQDVTDFVSPPHEQPREEDKYNGSESLTRVQSAAAAARLRRESSVNVKAKAAASRTVGGGGS